MVEFCFYFPSTYILHFILVGGEGLKHTNFTIELGEGVIECALKENGIHRKVT